MLLHGHQADFFNAELWMLGRLLVRYLWRPLEFIGLQNPFDASQATPHPSGIERKLIQFAKETGTPIIAGHTHRPMADKNARYFNTGSSVHARYITNIEISDGALTLVKWTLAAKEDHSISVVKEPLSPAIPFTALA